MAAAAPRTLTFTKPTCRANTSWQPLLSLSKHRLCYPKRSKQSRVLGLLHLTPSLTSLPWWEGCGEPQQMSPSMAVPRLGQQTHLAESKHVLSGFVSSPGEHAESWSRGGSRPFVQLEPFPTLPKPLCPWSRPKPTWKAVAYQKGRCVAGPEESSQSQKVSSFPRSSQLVLPSHPGHFATVGTSPSSLPSSSAG